MSKLSFLDTYTSPGFRVLLILCQEEEEKERLPVIYNIHFCSVLYARTWIIFEIDYDKQLFHAFQRFNATSTMKIGNLMDLPPTVLLCGLFTTGNREIHYPAPLLELWVRSTQPPHDSPSCKNSISVSFEEASFFRLIFACIVAAILHSRERELKSYL